jgi:hypothetical protein
VNHRHPQRLNWIVLAAVVALAGCQSAKVATPLPADLLGGEPEKQLAFWHTLAERTLTSNNEALHGVLLYADSDDSCKTYEERVALLKSRKMIPASFNEPADQAVARGTVAVAVCRILSIRGGVMLHLLDGSPRYAVRELAFIGLFPPSSPQQTFSGPEFLGVIGRVEDYERSNAKKD